MLRWRLILPKDKINEYRNVFDWLIDEPCSADYFITAFISVLGGSKFEKPFAELYFAKSIDYGDHFIPEATLLIGFANVFVQIFLPLSSLTMNSPVKNKQPELNLYPPVIYFIKVGNKSLSINPIDLKSKDNVTYNETLHFTYESGEFNINI